MGIFDKLKNQAQSAVQNGVRSTVANGVNRMQSGLSNAAGQVAGAVSGGTYTVSFSALPTSLAELQALPEAALTSPAHAAALFLCAMTVWPADRNEAIAMINYLKGPQPLSPYQTSFLNDRMMDNGVYLPLSYFNGATPQNSYTPSQPFTLVFSENPYSYSEAGYCKLYITSGGADSPRYIQLRQKGDQWFLWEQFVLVGIRTPAEKDPWA